MELMLWLFIMVPVSLLFTGLGVFSWCRKKPMWFWSGIPVPEEEITDVRVYNRANGIMWLSFSLIFWVSTVLGVFHVKAAGIVLTAGSFLGIPALVLGYRLIERKYRKK